MVPIAAVKAWRRALVRRCLQIQPAQRDRLQDVAADGLGLQGGGVHRHDQVAVHRHRAAGFEYARQGVETVDESGPRAGVADQVARPGRGGGQVAGTVGTGVGLAVRLAPAAEQGGACVVGVGVGKAEGRLVEAGVAYQIADEDRRPRQVDQGGAQHGGVQGVGLAAAQAEIAQATPEAVEPGRARTLHRLAEQVGALPAALAVAYLGRFLGRPGLPEALHLAPGGLGIARVAVELGLAVAAAHQTSGAVDFLAAESGVLDARLADQPVRARVGGRQGGRGAAKRLPVGGLRTGDRAGRQQQCREPRKRQTDRCPAASRRRPAK